jgi:RNA polymerase sigma factor (sigma-70 family)
MNKFSESSEHFRVFAKNLESAIDRYGDVSEETLYSRQKRQLETLVDLEDQFKACLLHHRWGASSYKLFIKHICDEKRNILAARPFFRERQPVFTGEISKALKAKAYRTLFKFHVNYQFIQFVMKSQKWPVNSKIYKLASEIKKQRIELVEMNMPLAISRARIFWSKTPKSQLTYMDMIQISCEGMLSAIDKYCLPYSTVFRSVAIGRILGNLIEVYSETLLHFYPNDKRKIYRANKLMHKFSGEQTINYEQLATEVNEGVELPHKTNAAEIAALVAASSCVSTDSSPNEENDVPTLSRFIASESTQPDVQVEKTEAMARMNQAIGKLSVIEKKLLRLKGVHF